MNPACSEKESQQRKMLFEQRCARMAEAHSGALKIISRFRRYEMLNPENLMAYFDLLYNELTEKVFKKFMHLMNLGSRSSSKMPYVLSRIYRLLRKRPELLQGFHMLVPADMNLTNLPKASASRKSKKRKLKASLKVEKPDVQKGSHIKKAKEKMKIAKSEKVNTKVKVKKGVNNKGITKKKNRRRKNKRTMEKSADTFINKVKKHFTDKPQVFCEFLDLLFTVKGGSSLSKPETETELFYKVSQLFGNNKGLIEEFKKFVPNATCRFPGKSKNDPHHTKFNISGVLSGLASPNKGIYQLSEINDPSLASVYKYGTYEEHLFFDEVRKALGHNEIYDNLLRCITLFNKDLCTKVQLVEIATNFLGRFPMLLKKLKDMLGFDEAGNVVENISMKMVNIMNKKNKNKDGPDVDFANGGRNGASYRALPKDFKHPKCSGRTPLCDEVLNDTWVSFPSWSEDSTFVTSCKTQYEEIMYRCEDERFELDMAICMNSLTIEVIEDLQRRINKMTPSEKANLQLNDDLGASSSVIYYKALHRLYGDKTEELYDGLKRNSIVAVPIILKRLKAKAEEWKAEQNKYNQKWREVVDKYYLKSLDPTGINFKQNDSKSFRPKSLLNELDMIYAETKENPGFQAAHFVLEFKEMNVFCDVIKLMVQALKRLPGVLKEDRQKVEHLICGFLPDFFNQLRTLMPHIDIEEDDGDSVEEMEVENRKVPGRASPAGSGKEDGSSDPESNSNEENEVSDGTDKNIIEEIDIFDRMESLPSMNFPYTVFFSNKLWFIFFRQFHILFERLSRLYHESTKEKIVLKREPDVEEVDQEEEYFRPSYHAIVCKLSILLSGQMDYAQFEEESRKLFGIHAFVSFTMDKLILSMLRQLLQVISDDNCKQSTSLFVQYLKNLAAKDCSSPLEASELEHNYLKKVEKLLEDEKCFKIVWHKKERTLTIQLLEQDCEDNTPDPCETEKWTNYLHNFVYEEACQEKFLKQPNQLPVILPRNLRRQKEYWRNKVLQFEQHWKSKEAAKYTKATLPMSSKKKKALSLLNPLLRKTPRLSAMKGANKTVPLNAEATDNVGSTETSGLLRDGSPVDIQIDGGTSVLDVNLLAEASAQNMGFTAQDNSMKNTLKDSIKPKESSEVFMKITREENNDDIDVEGFEDEEKTGRIEIGQKHGDIQPKDSSPTKQIVSESSPNQTIAASVVVGNLVHQKISVDRASVKDVAADAQIDVTASCIENVAGNTSLSQDIAAYTTSTKHIKIGKDKVQDKTRLKNDKKSKADKISSGNKRILKVSKSDSDHKGKRSGSHFIETSSVDSSSIQKSQSLQQKRTQRQSDHSPKAKKQRMVSTYSKRRVKRSSMPVNKGRKRRNSTLKLDFEDNPKFDFASFLELNEEEKVWTIMQNLFIINDAEEGAFKFGRYKFQFVMNGSLYVYHKESLPRSRQIHQEISEIKTSNFDAWHRVWLSRFTTPAMEKSCDEWFIRCQEKKYKSVKITVTDVTKPPYIPYNMYKVKYYKIKKQAKLK